MAKAIAQHYANICRALAGKTKWMPDGLPVYPLVLTPEDWFLFSPRVEGMLNDRVCRLMADAGIPKNTLKKMPYTVASAYEFEIVSQVIAKVGIRAVMSKRTEPDRQSWSLLPLVHKDLAQELQRVDILFADELSKLVPEEPPPEGRPADRLITQPG
jgi:hypothetical protein